MKTCSLTELEWHFDCHETTHTCFDQIPFQLHNSSLPTFVAAISSASVARAANRVIEGAPMGIVSLFSCLSVNRLLL